MTGLIAVIDALPQDLAAHGTDLIAQIVRFNDTQMLSLGAAIRGGLSCWDELKDAQMCSLRMRVLRHPVGEAAMNSAAGGCV